MSNWIKCSDRMPEKNGPAYECCIVRVKINDEGNTCNSYDWFDGDQWDNNHVDDVTHWMYMKDIPEPNEE